MRAVVLLGKYNVEVRDIPKPTPGPGEIVVTVHAAGLNPIDWKHAFINDRLIGTVSGCDFAGVVEAVGPDVPAGMRVVGERVAGFIHGSNPAVPGNGSFAEYLVAPASLVFAIPESVSYEAAAAQSVAAITAAQMLWQSQQLPTPDAPGDKSKFFLVWSGATGVGQWLIQLAHLSGLALGAEAVFDYRNPDVAQRIREYTRGALASGGICEIRNEGIGRPVAALGDAGGVCSITLFPMDQQFDKDVKLVLVLAYTIFNKAVESPVYLPAEPAIFEATKGYYQLIARLLAQDKIQLVPVRVFGDLESVGDGMKEMREGRVSGEQLVFKII